MPRYPLSVALYSFIVAYSFFSNCITAGVGAAFAILSDANKRANYDRYGESDDGAGSAGMRRGGGDDARSRHYARYEDQISPDDIFNMFFGSGAFGGGETVYSDGRNTYRVRRDGRGGGPQHTHAEQHGRGEGDATVSARSRQLMQLLPIIVLILFTLFSFSPGVPAPADERMYSLDRSDSFRTSRTTRGSHAGLVPHLPYWVREDFSRRIGRDDLYLARVSAVVGCCCECVNAFSSSSFPSSEGNLLFVTWVRSIAHCLRRITCIHIHSFPATAGARCARRTTFCADEALR